MTRYAILEDDIKLQPLPSPPPLTAAKFIAVGAPNTQDSPILMTTSDTTAVTWANRSAAAATAFATAILQDVCYSASLNRWVAVGYDSFNFGNPAIIHSDDGGNTWSLSTPDPTTDFQIESVCWTGTKFIAVGHDSGNTIPIVANSTDGITWVQRTSNPATATLWHGVFGISGLAIAVGFTTGVSAPKVMISANDGDSWSTETPPGGLISALNNVTMVSAGTHVAVGFTTSSTRGGIGTSTNGTSWTEQTTGLPSDQQYYDVAWNGTIYAAVGMDFNSNVEGRAASSPDGTTWTARTTDPAGPVNTFDGPNFLSVAALSGGGFVACGRDNNTFSIPYLMYSADGMTWTARTPNPSTGAILLGVGAGV